MGRSQALYLKAKKMIPGGTQLLSKRPEMFLPDQWPADYAKAKGCEIWDLDGRKYIDMSLMGVGSCTVGYADDDIDAAVKQAIDRGSMSTLNAPEEVELAEKLIELHPWARMVRYARGGGDAMAVAIRIARAKAKREMVIFSGYHGWHDWYLSANLAEDDLLDGHLLPGLNPLGVPRGLKGSSIPFQYNDTEALLKLTKKHGSRIGVIVLEAIRNKYPDKTFISTIRREADRIGAVLVVDEVSSGWRLNLGGAHLLFGLEPDIAVFAKGMSNGYPMAAIIGRKDVMQVAQETFISSTYWTERIGPVAALATIKKMQDKKVQAHLIKMGKKVKAGWKSAAEDQDLKIDIEGIDPLPHFSFHGRSSLAQKTLFTQFMLDKGFLASTGYYASYAHKDAHINAYLKVVGEAFAFIAEASAGGNPEKHLNGPVCHSGFKRLT